MTSSSTLRLDLIGHDITRAGAVLEGVDAQDALALNQTVDFDFDPQGFVVFTPILFKIRDDKVKERKPSIHEMMASLNRLSQKLNLPPELRAHIALWVEHHALMRKHGAMNKLTEEAMATQALALVARAKLDRNKTILVLHDIQGNRADKTPASSLVPDKMAPLSGRRGNHAALKLPPMIQVEQKNLKSFDLLKLIPVPDQPKPETSNDNDPYSLMQKRLARLKREQKYKALSQASGVVPHPVLSPAQPFLA